MEREDRPQVPDGTGEAIDRERETTEAAAQVDGTEGPLRHGEAVPPPLSGEATEPTEAAVETTAPHSQLAGELTAPPEGEPRTEAAEATETTETIETTETAETTETGAVAAALRRAIAWLTPRRVLQLVLALALAAAVVAPTVYGLGRWRQDRERQLGRQSAEDARAARFAAALSDPDAPLNGDKLIAWAEEKGRCSDRFLPPELLAAEPEELGAVLHYAPARGGEGWELSLVRGRRRLAGPVRVAGEGPAAAAGWVAAVWSGDGLGTMLDRLEDLPGFGAGDRLVLLGPEGADAPDPGALAAGADAAAEGASPLPEELRARSPWQIGATLSSELRDGQRLLRLTPLRGGAEARALFPRETGAEELQTWVRDAYAAWQRQLAFAGLAEDRSPGGGEKAIGLQGGVYVDSFLPEELRAASPEEVGLVIRRDDTGWEAVEPCSGVSLGRLAADVGEAELGAWVRDRLDELTLLTRLPQLLEGGAIDPAADRLARLRGDWARFDTEHIPQELRARRAEQVRGLLLETPALSGTVGFFPDEEGHYHRVFVSLESLELSLVDMYTDRVLATGTLRASLPGELTVPADSATYGPIRVDEQRVEDWVRENWPEDGDNG